MSTGYVEIGSGDNAAGLAAVAKSLKILDDTDDRAYGPQIELSAAQHYAQMGRHDLAFPMLARLFAAPEIGGTYSPVMLWLDPMWDPIRHDPRFQALLAHYAKYRPAVTYDTVPAANVSSTASR